MPNSKRIDKSTRLPAVLLSAIALAVVIGSMAACSSMGGADLKFADWLLPVPEGTPVKEYAPIAVADRDPDAVRLIEDLVIGGDPYDEQTLFYQAGAIVASPAGDIFVIDRGNNRIQMFSPDGAYKRTLGKAGQGPGEFAGLYDMIISEGRLVVYDSRNRRYSYWTLDGQHIADHVPTPQVTPLSMEELADGSFVSMLTERDEDRSGRRVVVRRAADGTELARLLEIPLPPPPQIISRDYRQMLQHSIRAFDDPRLTLTAGSGEIVYVTPVHEYQVFALSDAGDMLWALRVAWPRPPYPEFTKDLMVESFAERFEEPLSAEDFEWPVHDSGVRTLRSDASGRLFVFPAIERLSQEPPESMPVDVYSPDGELLAAGIVAQTWTYARGDHVYALRGDADLDQTTVVRYRLEVREQ